MTASEPLPAAGKKETQAKALLGSSRGELRVISEGCTSPGVLGCCEAGVSGQLGLCS